jgi:hypothetical protein
LAESGAAAVVAVADGLVEKSGDDDQRKNLDGKRRKIIVGSLLRS